MWCRTLEFSFFHLRIEFRLHLLVSSANVDSSCNKNMDETFLVEAFLKSSLFCRSSVRKQHSRGWFFFFWTQSQRSTSTKKLLGNSEIRFFCSPQQKGCKVGRPWQKGISMSDLVGIGIVVNRDSQGGLIIDRIVENGAAAMSTATLRLQKGDRIISAGLCIF